jgi:large subunit ribosomal protein L3
MAAAKVIIGRKLGMTQFFTEDGRRQPVTVIEAGPCPVTAVRVGDADGYDAVQLAFEPVTAKKITRPEIGHLAKAGVGPHRHLHEFRGRFDDVILGEPVTVERFEPGDAVKVIGRSKGKGFAGTIKRHNFSRGPVSHGSHNVRAPGSIGQSATPSRVIKGLRMSGHMGAERVTQRGLTVLDVDVERNLLIVTGAVPGATGGVVFVLEDR